MTDARAAVCETHVSTVFFTGDRAYKLKKPVSFGFLDFSTREAREAVCHREVELNRRLAPDVYLGVADVVGPDGEPCDHLVVMRRMPDDRRLSTLVEDGTATVDDMDRIARVVAAFHAGARSADDISSAATVDAVQANWVQSFEEMRPFVGTVLPADTSERVEELALRYLAGRRTLFDHRIADGRVRDGHGDLLTDDIFMLDDGPRILDCIEFADRLRYGDVLNDVAFLAMDLEFRGAPSLAESFLVRWAELTAETHPVSLVNHYVAYRAHVRAKVACLRAAQGDDTAGADAVRHLELTRARLERGRVGVALVGGLPGTGKSTLAEGIGRELGWVVLHSDVVRKELAGLSSEAQAGAAYGEGIYGAAATDAAYAEMLRRVRRALELGESVVLDASWTAERHRRRAQEVARDTAAELVEIECRVPEEVSSYRLRTRANRVGSDATPAIAHAMARREDPWLTAIVIDTDRPVPDVLRDALDLLPPSDET